MCPDDGGRTSGKGLDIRDPTQGTDTKCSDIRTETKGKGLLSGF